LRVIAEVDDNDVEVGKVQGTFGWHAQETEDELFLVLKGHLRIEMKCSAVELGEGASSAKALGTTQWLSKNVTSCSSSASQPCTLAISSTS
jgi:mannose-6-phosphate isomerase-like protein (cupin superfamily)